MTNSAVQVNPSNEPFQRSFETTALIELLKNTDIDQLVSYGQMKEALNGVNVQLSKGRNYLYSALEIIQPEGYYFRCIPGDGYLRITHAEAVRYNRTLHKQRLRSDTKRFRSRLENIDPSKLPEQSDRQNYHLALADLSLRESIGSKETERLLSSHVANRPSQSLGMTSEESKNLLKAIASSGFTG